MKFIEKIGDLLVAGMISSTIFYWIGLATQNNTIMGIALIGWALHAAPLIVFIISEFIKDRKDRKKWDHWA